ncbi:hypothetical protein CONPUDRAFT_119753 [Coniophora puteana RWD-64-598 SS2]|uniref:Calcofluor white hypersensitive protein n=1 Tax=Coniophora puteana (strain RWD-64-598) TaxID=741705 RepID=A0A5M3MZS2_CONPW|nr:uncharacterized protein CONPUDRAFT_119753 [Coniophora puteana RWD-64-598 SS2]EIW84131.1 hypothetical protein CONPUDRAFT_119753 [Coniophora puteana RWD-64-598 SS2]
MATRRKSAPPLAKPPAPIAFDANIIAGVHTILSLAAFATALFFGCALHYKKIVKNGIAGYPQEWFPSVSATIGDWYPERNFFQILIAITSGPRFALVFLQYYLARHRHPAFSKALLTAGLLRTLSCGGWVYITSNDDHDAHDVLMVTYILCNVPWMFGGIATTPLQSLRARRRRRVISTLFFASIIPMVYFFVQHKVYGIPGAYTRYSFFEWALILLDVAYDSIIGTDLSESNLRVAIGPSLDVKDVRTNTLNRSEDTVKHSPNTQSKDANDPPDILTTDAPQSDGSVPYSKAGRLESLHETCALLLKSHTREPVSFLCDVYLSYIFWSLFTSLLPTLFFFSVWQLGVSGHELALLSILSPALLGISFLRKWALTRAGSVTLQGLSLAGIVAYALPRPSHRLMAVAFANIIAVFHRSAQWSLGDRYHGIIAALGFALSALSKHANHSNNPVWPMVTHNSGGYNKIGLALAIIALVEQTLRPDVGNDPEETAASGPPVEKKEKNSAPDTPWLSSSVALGSLIFSLHYLLSEPGTIISWTWTGYSNGQPNGPLPHVHGFLTIIAQSFGILLAILAERAGMNPLASQVWFMIGSCGAYVLYSHSDWLGFLGGLLMTVFLMSITPSLVLQLSGTAHAGKAFFTAFFTAMLLYLANVWTVAYAFVPFGGSLLRERTDFVLVAQFAALSLSFQWRTPTPKFINTDSDTLTSLTRTCSVALVAVLSLSSVLVTLYRMPVMGPQPYRKGDRLFNAGIWTVHFGIDNHGHDSQRLIRDIIGDMKVDVMGLLESDLHRPVYGNRDLTRVIAEELGYYVDLGPGPNKHTWGAALLSKFPILESHHHLLPSPVGELAPAISAVLDVFGTNVTVVVSHNGQEEDPLDRELQSKELARIMAEAYPQPTIFLGYVVTKPHAKKPNPYEILVEDGLMYDIDAEDWDRWCEYILYRGLYRTAYARISRGIVTDTEVQIGQFAVPKHGFSLVNDARETRMRRTWKEGLPESHWFPMEYYGNQFGGGVNGHYYHVFHTPLYYKLPDDAAL